MDGTKADWNTAIQQFGVKTHQLEKDSLSIIAAGKEEGKAGKLIMFLNILSLSSYNIPVKCGGIHTLERFCQSIFCGKTFKSRNKMRVHRKLHTENAKGGLNLIYCKILYHKYDKYLSNTQGPFSCTECRKRPDLTTTSNLNHL